MKLNEIKKALKTVGLANVFMRTEFGYDKKVWRNPTDNKTVQGILGGSMGPITCTDAHIIHNREKEAKVKEKLVALGSIVEDDPSGAFEAAFVLDNGKTLTLRFWWSKYPTYTRSSNLDSGYKSFWLTFCKIN